MNSMTLIHRSVLALGLAAVVQTTSTPAHAQPAGGWELGLDGGVSFVIRSDYLQFHGLRFTQVQFPARSVRVGFGLTNHVAMELAAGLEYLHVKTETPPNPEATEETISGGRAAWTVAWNGAAGSHPYLRVGPAVVFSDDGSLFGVEGGFGVKPLVADLWAARLEAGITKFFENEPLRGYWEPSLKIGISYFTKDTP